MDWNEFASKLLPQLLLFITGALTVGGLWLRSRVQRDIQRNKTEEIRLQAEAEKAKAAAAKDTIFNQIVSGQEERLKRVENDFRDSVKANNELEKQIIGLEHKVSTVETLEKQVADLGTKYEADLKQRDEQHQQELTIERTAREAAETKLTVALERITALEAQVKGLENRLTDTEFKRGTNEVPAVKVDDAPKANGDELPKASGQ